jgi:hypothetical protein
MSTRLIRLFVATMLIALLGAVSGCAAGGTPVPSPNQVPSSQLVETPGDYDGGEVTFSGEAIGEAMERGDMAWLHLNDDAYYQLNTEEGTPLGGYNSGMAVWVPAVFTDAITHYGDHSNAGDIVRVTGTFNAACAEHGGDMDIHADALLVVSPGRDVREPLDRDKALWAIVLAALAAAAFFIDRRGARLARDGGR